MPGEEPDKPEEEPDKKEERTLEAFELREAQLYRMLCGLFGKERVIPHARISFVCGGDMPRLPLSRYPKYEEWAKSFRCLCTVLNERDEPKLVVEFFSGFHGAIDPHEALREHYLPAVLRLRNIWYVKVSEEDFNELLSPERKLSFLQIIDEQIGNEVFIA